MPLTPGQVLNSRYRIVKLLGQGGFGAVYKAWDLNLKGPCAVKENFKLSPAEQAQFSREASLLFKLHHPNLPRVFDQFTIQGEGQYLVMDFIEGQDLGDLIHDNGGPLPEDTVIGWLTQICEALDYLHSQTPPVIHRDIKPSNIKITPDGRAMLVDFGIAKTGITGTPTTAAARGVTPGYSPPEQYGSAQTDARTDIYAMGATLYALLTGQEPPSSTDRVVGIPLPPPRQLNQGIPPALEALVLKAMAIEPVKRYPSAAEFKQALLTYKSTPPPKPKRWVWAAAIAGVLLCLAAGATGAAIAFPDIFSAKATPTERLDFETSEPASDAAGRAEPTSIPTEPAGLVVTSPPPQADATLTFTPTATVRQVQASPTLAPPTPTPTTAYTPTNTPTPPVITDASLVPMVFIPAGSFMMGADVTAAYAECLEMCAACDCTELEFQDEAPVHSVYVDSFYIDQYEVTNASFAEFLNSQGNQSEGGATWFDASSTSVQIHLSGGVWSASAGYADYPVFRVTWYGAQAYCAWRGGRLPTEAEWERAARGGQDGAFYIWGESFRSGMGNFCDASCVESWANSTYNDGYAFTAPVGSYPANGYDLYDMAGNVWEWTQDWHSFNYYATSPSSNPTGPATGDRHTVRGGCYFNGADYLRPAIRFPIAPDSARDSVGFRCVSLP